MLIQNQMALIEQSRGYAETCVGLILFECLSEWDVNQQLMTYSGNPSLWTAETPEYPTLGVMRYTRASSDLQLGALSVSRARACAYVQ